MRDDAMDLAHVAIAFESVGYTRDNRRFERTPQQRAAILHDTHFEQQFVAGSRLISSHSPFFKLLSVNGK
jgi:hypothetical protein